MAVTRTKEAARAPTLPNFTPVEVYDPSDQHWVGINDNPTLPGRFDIRSR